jgi:hypothetical protein
MINVRGLVIPAKWDKKGNVVVVLIATDDEEEYHIENRAQTAKLIPFLRQEVKVSGSLKNKGGKKIINIKKIEKN